VTVTSDFGFNFSDQGSYPDDPMYCWSTGGGALLDIGKSPTVHR
jgi:hypothetical protein